MFIPTQVISAASKRLLLFRGLMFITSRGFHNPQLVIHKDLHLHQFSSDRWHHWTLVLPNL
ncbi:hypothetical protein SORBI_3009G090566 [Sorghum bicolor]|uniref:Uncharacterized protein n=1 Tax=Sorghum bicolor TaxID=4558 RepID=A0A1B6P7M4_SORBI|nr:hypothetical protein SORBI_3009G090566 [Sorghum bicolor]